MTSLPVLGAVWAQSLNATIGNKGGMPWHVPADLKHFKEITLGCPVIMGRYTWESFPEKFRPLPGRENIVVSSRVSSPLSAAGALWVPSLDMALELASSMGDKLWIIGGGKLYAEALSRTDLPGVFRGALTLVERTVLAHDVAGDTVAPELNSSWIMTEASSYQSDPSSWVLEADQQSSPVQYRFETWERELS